MATVNADAVDKMATPTRTKLAGRAFYESIGSPKYIVAPMVDRSEFAWRMLTRSYMSEKESKKLLAYSPMLHARLFGEQARNRDENFQPIKDSLTSKSESSTERWLDGNPQIDRPLFVQFCANKPDELFNSAQYVAPYCDAVDLNLGCPQGIAKSGRYGAFLQEDWDTIHKMINKLHTELSVPVTAKMRILDTKEKTLEYAQMILNAGANILTVHGRRREQKGHNTGIADWSYIRYLRDNLPPETVIFANGNILNNEDLDSCLEATGADGIMSAEGNLSDPAIFAKPPSDPESREYWRGPDGRGGYRIDGVLRRYFDIIYKYVLGQEPPQRAPLYISSDPEPEKTVDIPSDAPADDEDSQPPRKKQKVDKKERKDKSARSSPNLRFMQGHMFQLLRPMLSTYTDIRDVLARTRAGDMDGFERVLSMIEAETKKALQAEAKAETTTQGNEELHDARTPSEITATKYGRPWFVCQPHIRPLPEEALKNGALKLSKKDRAKLEAETDEKIRQAGEDIKRDDDSGRPAVDNASTEMVEPPKSDLPKAATVCG